jgi:hypothetical protein
VDRRGRPVLEQPGASRPLVAFARVQPGAPVPSVIVYDQDVKPVDIADLAQEGPYLLSFYLYDWTGT